ncbi:hypothetical protein [Actinokineospora globicatena]|uniref:hypothetical protein n=1 Tax=Actinokineospora globicatena TaxID=103729 RepID=UPI0020A5BA8B|nr:hypothetical protein [Actinokineospora globicatena]GLW78479.1 hypothetical protein Aglo01_29610 [Actinokineospora globicatena]GLW84857.1 hypothetical protein Aglo02_24970 [Actinokineospora globicatena]
MTTPQDPNTPRAEGTQPTQPLGQPETPAQPTERLAQPGAGQSGTAGETGAAGQSGSAGEAGPAAHSGSAGQPGGAEQASGGVQPDPAGQSGPAAQSTEHLPHPEQAPQADGQSTAYVHAPGAVPPRSRWRRAGATTGRVARHRATLVVAALLIGGAVGAGITALALHDHDDRPRVVDARDRGGDLRGGPDRRGDGDFRGRWGGSDDRSRDDRGGDRRGGDRGDGPGRG